MWEISEGDIKFHCAMIIVPPKDKGSIVHPNTSHCSKYQNLALFTEKHVARTSHKHALICFEIYEKSHGTFTCVPMGKFLKISFHVPWFIRLGRECGKSGNFAHVP